MSDWMPYASLTLGGLCVGCVLSTLDGCAGKPHPAATRPEPAWHQSLSDDAAPSDARRLETAGHRFAVIYRVRPDPIPLNEPFAIDVMVFDDDGSIVADAQLSVDARMPHHRHGMIVEPKVIMHETGGARVEGMLFHMPGRWELYFDITRHGRTERAQDIIMLD
jgi:hypothetical protein